MTSQGHQLARETFAVVLAGGNGTRLGALTRWQCKPALPFAGHFRNIDFTLSNCVNSYVRRIGVLTQYKAQSLIGHITNGWNFLPRHLGEFVEVWPAQQRLHSSWYAGTADAVRQNLDLIVAQRAKYTLVLAGDHIYKMDYGRLLAQHAASGADITVACVPVPLAQAGEFGVLGIDASGRVRTFKEKPAPDTLGLTSGNVLASMGVYVFSTDYLVSRLRDNAAGADVAHDFGRDILPAAVSHDRVGAVLFTDQSGRPGYWRDVGTLDAYWKAHMELLTEHPVMDLYDPRWPVWTLPEQSPPARLIRNHAQHGFVANSMLSAGTVVRGATITSCVLGTNVQVHQNSFLDESVVLPGARVGANCLLRRVIVDSNTVVPDGTVIDESLSGDNSQSRIALLTDESLAALTLQGSQGRFESEPRSDHCVSVTPLPAPQTRLTRNLSTARRA